jgi:hypothetical protein
MEQLEAAACRIAAHIDCRDRVRSAVLLRQRQLTLLSSSKEQAADVCYVEQVLGDTADSVCCNIQ